MKKLPKTSTSPVLRTDFSDDNAWKVIQKAITQPGEFGLQANVTFIDDRAFADVTAEQLVEMIPEDFGHTFIIVVDRVAVASPEHPVLVVDLYESPGRNFRAVPAQIQGIENNLSIANMDFDDFAGAVDGSGVFRGFDES
jgi:hypothetical protein